MGQKNHAKKLTNKKALKLFSYKCDPRILIISVCRPIKLPSNWLRYDICCGDGTGIKLGSLPCELPCWFFCCCAAKHWRVRTNTPSSSFSSISYMANVCSNVRVGTATYGKGLVQFCTFIPYFWRYFMLFVVIHHTVGFQASSDLRGRGRKTKNTHYNYRKTKKERKKKHLAPDGAKRVKK